MSEISDNFSRFVRLDPSPEQFAASLAASKTASKTRRQRLNKIHTPFKQATTRFVAVNIRRTRLEEVCVRNNYQMEMECLRLECRRIDLEDKRVKILNQCESLSEKLSKILIQLRP